MVTNKISRLYLICIVRLELTDKQTIWSSAHVDTLINRPFGHQHTLTENARNFSPVLQGVINHLINGHDNLISLLSISKDEIKDIVPIFVHHEICFGLHTITELLHDFDAIIRHEIIIETRTTCRCLDAFVDIKRCPILVLTSSFRLLRNLVEHRCKLGCCGTVVFHSSFSSSAQDIFTIKQDHVHIVFTQLDVHNNHGLICIGGIPPKVSSKNTDPIKFILIELRKPAKVGYIVWNPFSFLLLDEYRKDWTQTTINDCQLIDVHLRLRSVHGTDHTSNFSSGGEWLLV